MNARHFFSIFSVGLILSASVCADTAIRILSVSGLSGPNQAYAGDTVRIGLEYVNREPFNYNVSNFFRIYSQAKIDSGSHASGTATWVSTVPGRVPYFTLSSARPRVGMQIDTSGGLSKSEFGALYIFNCFGCDGSGEDTITFAAAANDPGQTGIPPLDSGLMFTIMLVTQRHTDSGNFICIDSSTNCPPTCTWGWYPFNAPSGTPNQNPVWAGPWCFELLPANQSPVDNEPDETLPSRFEVFQNYPNPFNPTTSIGYALPEAGHVRIVVYNVLGEQVRVLVDSRKPAGEHTVIWDGRDASGSSMPSGVYFYKIAAHQSSQTRKMLLLK